MVTMKALWTRVWLPDMNVPRSSGVVISPVSGVFATDPIARKKANPKAPAMIDPIAAACEPSAASSGASTMSIAET